MAINLVNIGGVANDGTGDDLREAFVKVNNNFTELDNRNPEQTTASNLGSLGEGLFAQKDGFDLQFKKIVGGGNVTVTADSNGVIISSVGGLQALVVQSDNGSITLAEGDTFNLLGGNNVTTTTTGSNGITITSQTELASDLSPQLGANLNGGGRDITNVRNTQSLVHNIDIRDIYGFNFGLISGNVSSIIEYLGAGIDVEMGNIVNPGEQDDSTINDSVIDLGTITNPL